jgi:hypothetical protein
LLLDLPQTRGQALIDFHPNGQSLAVSSQNETLLYPLLQPLGRIVALESSHPTEICVDEACQWLACSRMLKSGLHHKPRLSVASLQGREFPSFAQPELDERVIHLLFLQSDRLLCMTRNKVFQLAQSIPGASTPPDAGAVEILLRSASLEAIAATPERWWAAEGKVVVARDRKTHEVVGSWTNSPPTHQLGVPQIHALAGSQNIVAAGGRDGSLTILSARDARPLATLRISENPVRRVVISPDEKHIAYSTLVGELFLLERSDDTTLRLRQSWNVFRDPVDALTFVGSDRLAAGGRGGVRIWNLDADHSEWLHVPLTRPVFRMVYSAVRDELFVLLRNERAVRSWPLNRLDQEIRRITETP